MIWSFKGLIYDQNQAYYWKDNIKILITPFNELPSITVHKIYLTSKNTLFSTIILILKQAKCR